MGIPSNLWKYEAKGTWEKTDVVPTGDQLSDWALTAWVLADVNGYSGATAIDLLNAIDTVWGVGSSFNWWGPSFWITYRRALHVQSENFLDDDAAVQLGSADKSYPALPYQAAIMAWGNAASLRHQVRHWFPGWSTRLIVADGQVNSTLNNALDAWCRLWFTPIAGTVHNFVPIVWDAANEEAREIVTIHRQSYLRTIRRRAVKAKSEIREL